MDTNNLNLALLESSIDKIQADVADTKGELVEEARRIDKYIRQKAEKDIQTGSDRLGRVSKAFVDIGNAKYVDKSGLEKSQAQAINKVSKATARKEVMNRVAGGSKDPEQQAQLKAAKNRLYEDLTKKPADGFTPAKEKQTITKNSTGEMKDLSSDRIKDIKEKHARNKALKGAGKTVENKKFLRAITPTKKELEERDSTRKKQWKEFNKTHKNENAKKTPIGDRIPFLQKRKLREKEAAAEADKRKNDIINAINKAAGENIDRIMGVEKKEEPALVKKKKILFGKKKEEKPVQAPQNVPKKILTKKDAAPAPVQKSKNFFENLRRRQASHGTFTDNRVAAANKMKVRNITNA